MRAGAQVPSPQKPMIQLYVASAYCQERMGIRRFNIRPTGALSNFADQVKIINKIHYTILQHPVCFTFVIYDQLQLMFTSAKP
jgi:hypothetical protein